MSEVTEKSLIKSIGSNIDQGRRFAFLLGAGASISSGIKGAGELAKKWLKEIEENDPDCFERIKIDPKYDAENIALIYTRIYQDRFKDFPDDGYREIEDLMSDKKVQPSFGYTVLAQILNKTRHNIVLTTNFDRLTETALLYYQNNHARVIAHEEMLNVIAIHDQKPTVVKIHRDMQFSPMSELSEVDTLDSKWNDIIRSTLNQYSLICLGYGGNDNGLMEIIRKELNNEPNAKVYWCYRGKIPEEIKDLGRIFKNQIKTVQIFGFDEFMLNLGNHLKYDELSKQIESISEKRLKQYKDQLAELIKKTASNNSSEAVNELVEETWWEVQLNATHETDLNKKEKIFINGLLKFPNSPELYCYYLLFIGDDLKDYTKAEREYKNALEKFPNNPDINHNYAHFSLFNTKNYDIAEKFFKKTLIQTPEDSNLLENYAIYLNLVKNDFINAEFYFKKSLSLNPDSANLNGNYTGFLIEQGKLNQAVKFLEIAEDLPNDSDNKIALEFELYFYRIVLFPTQFNDYKSKILNLIESAHKPINWDFSKVLLKAQELNHPNILELKEFADRIINS